MDFLRAACSIARYSVYSLHKACAAHCLTWSCFFTAPSARRRRRESMCSASPRRRSDGPRRHDGDNTAQQPDLATALTLAARMLP